MQYDTDTFIEINQGKRTAIVRRQGATAIAEALFSENACAPAAAMGRGNMRIFPWHDGREGMLRLFLRGGIFRHVLKNRFVLCNRPLREFCAHQTVIAQGVSAPPLLGVRWERHGLFFSGALATVRLAGQDLDEWLHDNKSRPEACVAVLRACGVLIRQMHEHGIYHGDLQVKNLFVGADGPVLLDFDRARIHRPPRPLARARNLLRLRRSFDKRGHPRSFYDTLAEGYGAVPPPHWLQALYSIKGCLSSALQRRRSTRI